MPLFPEAVTRCNKRQGIVKPPFTFVIAPLILFFALLSLRRHSSMFSSCTPADPGGGVSKTLLPHICRQSSHWKGLFRRNINSNDSRGWETGAPAGSLCGGFVRNAHVPGGGEIACVALIFESAVSSERKLNKKIKLGRTLNFFDSPRSRRERRDRAHCTSAGVATPVCLKSSAQTNHVGQHGGSGQFVLSCAKQLFSFALKGSTGERCLH